MKQRRWGRAKLSEIEIVGEFLYALTINVGGVIAEPMSIFSIEVHKQNILCS